MASRLGWYYRQKRLRLGLTVETLAVRLGYRNVRKGVRRLLRFEHTGYAPDALLAKLADALGIDYGTTLDLMERDAQQPALAASRTAPGTLSYSRTAPRPPRPS
jgi:transcriptional regulator with XRE-family HTH domain